MSSKGCPPLLPFPGEVARVLSSKDLYEVLEVSRDADDEAVRRAKRLKSLATHPDKLGGAVGAKEAFQRVTEVRPLGVEGGWGGGQEGQGRRGGRYRRFGWGADRRACSSGPL